MVSHSDIEATASSRSKLQQIKLQSTSKQKLSNGTTCSLKVPFIGTSARQNVVYAFLLPVVRYE